MATTTAAPEFIFQLDPIAHAGRTAIVHDYYGDRTGRLVWTKSAAYRDVWHWFLAIPSVAFPTEIDLLSLQWANSDRVTLL